MSIEEFSSLKSLGSAEKISEVLSKNLNEQPAKEGVDLVALTKKLAKRRLEKNNNQDSE